MLGGVWHRKPLQGLAGRSKARLGFKMTALEKIVKPQIETVPIDMLKRDYRLYPRESVDFATVERFKNAMKAGAKFPPIRACVKTGKIIDGFHRFTAYSELQVKEVEIVGEEVDNDADFFLRAVDANKGHGLGYRQADYEKIVKIARLLKLERKTVAFAVALPIQRFDELERMVPAAGPTTTVKASAAYVHKVTATPQHRIDPLPSDRQRTSSPVGYFFFFNQVISFLKSPECDASRQDVLHRLVELGVALLPKLGSLETSIGVPMLHVNQLLMALESEAVIENEQLQRKLLKLNALLIDRLEPETMETRIKSRIDDGCWTTGDLGKEVHLSESRIKRRLSSLIEAGLIEKTVRGGRGEVQRGATEPMYVPRDLDTPIS